MTPARFAHKVARAWEKAPRVTRHAPPLPSYWRRVCDAVLALGTADAADPWLHRAVVAALYFVSGRLMDGSKPKGAARTRRSGRGNPLDAIARFAVGMVAVVRRNGWGVAQRNRPGFLGLLGENAVYRFDDLDALRRVLPQAESSHPEPFEPGLYVETFGIFVRLPRDFATHAAQVGRDLVAACSTPRLARAILALGETPRAA